MSHAHYIKDINYASFPKRFLFIDTETIPNTIDGIDYHKMRLGITCYITTGKTPYEVKTEKWNFFYDQESICRYIDSLAYEKKPIWILASNPKFDLGAIAFVKWFTQWGYELEFLAEKGMVFILFVRQGKRRIKVVAIQNYITSSIKRIGETFGLKKLDVDIFTDDINLLTIYCFRDVEILMLGFLKYYQYIFDHEMGTFSTTKTSQAFTCFRHKFMKHSIMIHDNEQAQQLERHSYKGGRVECFKIGKQPKQKYVQLDVNSMYPFVMQKYTYPVKLEGKIQPHNIDALKLLLNTHCVTAHVYLETDEPIYAKSINGKCCFPVGKFWTTLNTRCLDHACYKGHIKDIRLGYFYKRARAFKPYVDYFWFQRLQSQKQGNVILKELCKIFLNSFYGKWAQLVPILVKENDIKDDKFTIENWYNEKTGQFGQTQTCFHKERTYVGKENSDNTFCGIAAHVTEDSRFELWKLISLGGSSNCYYCDTDSLIVTEETYNKYYKKLHSNELGKLKIEYESDYLEIFALKDYKIGSKVRKKGVGKSISPNERGKYEVLTSYSFRSLMKMGLQDAAILTYVEKELYHKYSKGVVLPTGEVYPFELTENEEDFQF